MALRIFLEANTDGTRKWAGIRWWSFQRPHWTVIALWVAPQQPIPHKFIDAEPLDLDNPSVVDAAVSLSKPIEL